MKMLLQTDRVLVVPRLAFAISSAGKRKIVSILNGDRDQYVSYG